MKAVGYIRVSTEEQAREGLSLEAQEAAIRSYAAMRGLSLVEVVSDAGVSAGKPLESREGGHRVLELVKHNKVRAVVAWKLDRVFRDASDCLNVTGKWDKASVSLHLIDLGGQAIDTSTAMGRFFLTVLAGAAEMERNLIRERTKTALAHKKAKGERVGSIPFGYKLAPDGVHLEPEPREQQIIDEARILRAKGLTLKKIASELWRDGLKSRTGNLFVPTQIKRMLEAS